MSFCASLSCSEFASQQCQACSQHYCDGCVKSHECTPGLVFALNGTKIRLGPSDPALTLTLNEYIRRFTPFKGTKLSCGQGGCGACTVVESRVVVKDGQTSVAHRTINSCLRSVATLNGSAITTVEGLGSQATGYHPVQKRLAAFNGTQCGYCSPGMVMAIYGNLKAMGDHAKMDEIESIFDGNICRCTGYRPILDAAKSFAQDSKVQDHVLETKCDAYDGSKDPAFPEFLLPNEFKHHELILSGKNPAGLPLSWSQPLHLNQVFDALRRNKDARIIGANTSVGIYATDKEANRVLVDVSRVRELLGISANSSHLVVGASTTLEELVRALSSYKAADGVFNSFAHLATRVRQIANIHVRNVGTVAGNLAMAKSKGFLSDLATALLAAGAGVELARGPDNRQTVSLEAFLSAPWHREELITAVHIPLPAAGHVLATFKCAVRPQNAHAYVNAGFKFVLSADGASIEHADCFFGGIEEPDKPTSHAVRAVRTQKALVGPLKRETLNAAVLELEKEIVPHNTHQSAAFSTRLVADFLYKAFLIALEEGSKKGKVAEPSANVRSAAEAQKSRPLSEARQSFPAITSTVAPVHQPHQKVEGLQQCSGEARFTDDIASVDGTLHAAFVHSPVAHAKIINLDPSPALAMPGVHGFLTAADMGTNSFELPGFCPPDVVLAKDSIMYHGQPLGIIVADTPELARKAAKMVIANVENLAVHVTLQQCKDDSKFSSFPCKMQIPMAGDALRPMKDAGKDVKGSVYLGTQKHFYMEMQTCYVVPDEDGSFAVHCSVQAPGMTMSVVSKALDIPFNKLNLMHRRSGGAFGGKALHPVPIVIAVTASARKLKRPVRLTLTREEDMWLCGGREETLCNYHAGYDDQGKITGMRAESTLGAGSSLGISGFVPFLHNRSLHEVYLIPDFGTVTEAVRSNLCPRTACRGPGEMSASVCMETVIEHVAHIAGLAPETVRERNFYPEDMQDKKSPMGETLTHYTINTMWASLKQKCEFDKRKAAIDAFNQANRWRKRGISMTPVGYGVNQGSKSARINIYEDGTVLITHTGTEMGQGLNTKACQVAAQVLGTVLGAPLNMSSIRFAETTTQSFPDHDITGGSTGSEAVCAAVKLACEKLVASLQALRREIDAAAEAKKEASSVTSWKALTTAAIKRNMDLSANARFGTNAADRLAYHNWGVCCSEVEIDVLTGESTILSSYLLYDCGQSLNPAIDIGQCEGAFIMGVGMLLREQEIVDHDGRLLSDNTWRYKVPLAGDIPLQFTCEFIQNNAFEKGVLSSKSSGEPPLVLSTSVLMAVRQAIKSARQDAGNNDFFQLPVPATPEQIQTACLVNSASFAV